MFLFHTLTKYLNKTCIFVEKYYHAYFQGPILRTAYIAVWLRPPYRYFKLQEIKNRGWGGLQWDNVNSRFCVNWLIDSKAESEQQTQHDDFISLHLFFKERKETKKG
jgi:hypothetical protein